MTFTIQDLVQNDHDSDGDTLAGGLISGTRDYGSLTCSTPMYRCTYTPSANVTGTKVACGRFLEIRMAHNGRLAERTNRAWD
jgi:hypothetical protein